MTDKKVTQKNITAAGNVVGGSLNNYNIYNSASPSLLAPIKHLLPKLKDEISSKKCCETLIDELAHYYYYKDDKPLRTVEEKLSAGGRLDELDRALAAKEYFNKQLQKYMFFETAQRLFALLLDSIEDAYYGKVYPLITAKADRATVDAVLSDALIDAIHAQIQDVDGILLTKKTLRGMLYFLTQKCVVDWD